MQLSDLYCIASIYFINGILDAQNAIDPSIIDTLVESNDLMIIAENECIKINTEDYMKFIISDLSKNNFLELRGALIFYKNKNLKDELCYLLNFIYKKGCLNSENYLGANMQVYLKRINHFSTKFLTPEGILKLPAWHDLIRKYLALLKFKHKCFKAEVLDKFMCDTTLNYKKIREVEQANEGRKIFIDLSNQ